VADPLGGSDMLEAWTAEIAERARALIRRVDERGGAVAAIESGFEAREIEETAYVAQKQLEAGRRIVVGVNAFREEKEETPHVMELDPAVERDQIERLQAFRTARDPSRSSAALARLRREAGEGRNLMPSILEGVKDGATVGEIVSALKEVFGEYRPSS
jgi:methylmalonyl-CoA mutase N-terminal domain/subunit